MAIWDNLGSRGNVEDRRVDGAGLALGGGGLGLVGVVIVLAMTLFGGTGNPTLDQIITDIASQGSSQTEDTGQYAGEDQYEVFAANVLGSTNDSWRQQLQASSVEYQDPKLVLFRTATQSGCGLATSSVGPHYCPLDQTIYLDETFFDELASRLGGSNGDVAQAYVIAHESAHHLQNILGTMEKAQATQQSNPDRANEVSIGLELQADCYAGVWMRSIAERGVLETGEISEAISALEAVGDDRIQEKVNGQISPETWTHGSSQQRVQWFNTGFEQASLRACTSI